MAQLPFSVKIAVLVVRIYNFEYDCFFELKKNKYISIHSSFLSFLQLLSWSEASPINLIPLETVAQLDKLVTDNRNTTHPQNGMNQHFDPLFKLISV